MKKLKIIFEDKYLIAVFKKEGLLTISRDKKFDLNLYDEVKEYLKKKNPQNKVFIVHRLDQDTSGIILFAKSEQVKYALQNNWNNVIRKYYGVIDGHPLKDSDILINNLYETKSLDVYVSKTGKKAITEYKVLKKNKKYSLVDINIKTGRKNQIRVQFKYIGHPIVGDKKYGTKNKKMYLEAYYLEFIHPITKENIILELPYSKEFQKII